VHQRDESHNVACCEFSLGKWEQKGGGAFVSDSTNAQFTQEEVLEMAQGNATALILTAFAFLKERGLDPDEYVAFFGRQAAPRWEELRGRPVADVARMAALNPVSVGATLRSLSGDDTHAEVLLAEWPDEEYMSELQLTQSDGDRLLNAFEPIMEYLGVRYAWQREGEAVKLTFERERT
jgi:hypothetical protein